MRRGVWVLTGISAILAVQQVAAQGDLDTSAFDRSIRVQDDLFMHVNGNWLRNTDIPADKSNYGSFIKLDDMSNDRIKEIIEAAAKETHAPGSLGQKVADFYRCFMDETKINQLGVSPIAKHLEKVSSLASSKDLVKHFGELGAVGVPTPIGMFIGVDEKKSTDYLATIVQAGTTLPDRDYYLSDDDTYVEARAALVAYINRVFDIAGIDNGPRGAEILALEKRLAEAQWSRTDMRDAEKTYNKTALDALVAKHKNIAWKELAAGAGVPTLSEVNVMTPSYFDELDKIIAETPLPVWISYLQFRLIDNFAPYLAQDLEQAHFELHLKKLAGIPEQKPRWKRAVGAISGAGAGDFGALGEAVGKLYVDQYFKPEAKARMDELVKNLLKAFDASIDDLTWMTDTTKRKAKEKLSKITTKIGYPEVWRDYSRLEIKAGDLVGNIIRSAQFEHHRQISRLGKPVDRTEWGMTPQTVNAYYNPPMNEIVFPAAILQSPFFSVDAPDALNYGGIGAVIGHEISHAFDDQGSRYDGDGNLVNWWTDQDRQAFEKLTKQLVAQYREYEPLPGKNLNGELTLGENIADLSGLSIAYKAYKMSQQGKEPEVLADWKGEQLFFIGWSRVWQRKYRDAEMIRRLATDPHSPSQFRANGPVMNIDAFYEVFNVREGDRLFKPAAERIRIW